LITIRLHAYQEGATIVLVFSAALVWTWWGTIDIVASATGKILPGGRTKVSRSRPGSCGPLRRLRHRGRRVDGAGGEAIGKGSAEDIIQLPAFGPSYL
jgi:hypothetical protein